MGLFRRRRTAGGTTGGSHRAEFEAVRAHLENFVRSRVGVEAFVEPATTVTPPTVLLVASTGEWTRRRVPDPALVRGLAQELAVPVYDVQLVGYPQRMRDWNSRQKLEARRAQEAGAAGASPSPVNPSADRPAPWSEPPGSSELPPPGR